ncbi:MAG: glycosyltransferase, partial [Elusimicrobiota bacterium]|nr:glycosyltransferase [Elusimicrobiota bacterium]
LGIPETALVVGTVARLEPVKGIKYFVDAIRCLITKLHNHQIIFLIVGDGSERKKLESLTCNLQLSDKVIFTGMRDDISELISIMDIYVQPSLNEGMGKTLVVASMLSKPVVATRVQGIPDVIIDGKTGILVPPKNSKLLAEGILKFITDESIRKEFGAAGRKYVTELVGGYERFSPERMIFLLEKLYDDLGG